MWGYDKEITNIQNVKYHMNGSVEAAAGQFEEWEGRSVFMSGLIEGDPPDHPSYPGFPHFAPGTLRIN